MKIVSWNSRGLKDICKRIPIKRLLKKIDLDIVLLQESKLEEFECLTSLLLNPYGAPRTSGGSLSNPLGILDTRKIRVVETLKGGYEKAKVNCITACKKSC